jgi:3,4-dihydroxy 2-butanone 4-phosphate synthase/GTP cyclohydrolase II
MTLLTVAPRHDPVTAISSITEIIEEARNGRPFILVDADDRENEGDIIIPAQFATPERINEMAKHARGLICLSVTAERAGLLGLEQMSKDNRSGHGTAFTVSIEAREGVTTGISAFDRAHTISVAINSGDGARDLVTPGHVFPLVARDGGVLVRAGHTEAAVDIARLAGLIPAAVICEVMNADGSMARLPDLVAFGARHGLKIGTIADLIAFRRRSETLVERVASGPFESHYGDDFTIHVYRDRIDGGEHVALVRGDVRPDADTLVRVHQFDLTADLLGYCNAHPDYVPDALRQLAAHDGPAVAVFVQDPDPRSVSRRVGGGRRDYADRASERDYGLGAQILRDVGVGQMTLLTSSNRKLAALEGFGLEVVSRRPIRDFQAD